MIFEFRWRKECRRCELSSISMLGLGIRDCIFETGMEEVVLLSNWIK